MTEKTHSVYQNMLNEKLGKKEVIEDKKGMDSNKDSLWKALAMKSMPIKK